MGYTPFGPQALSGTSLAVTGAATVGGSISAGSSPGGPLNEIVGSTGGAGLALINGTQNIFAVYTAPADGADHRINLIASLDVTSAETGGAVTLSFTNPGGTAANPTVFAAGLGVGSTDFQVNRLIEAGTTVTLAQTSALTLGAAVIYAELWAS